MWVCVLIDILRMSVYLLLCQCGHHVPFQHYNLYLRESMTPPLVTCYSVACSMILSWAGGVDCCGEAGGVDCCGEAGGVDCCGEAGGVDCCGEAGGVDCCGEADGVDCCGEMEAGGAEKLDS